MRSLLASFSFALLLPTATVAWLSTVTPFSTAPRSTSQVTTTAATTTISSSSLSRHPTRLLAGIVGADGNVEVDLEALHEFDYILTEGGQSSSSQTQQQHQSTRTATHSRSRRIVLPNSRIRGDTTTTTTILASSIAPKVGAEFSSLGGGSSDEAATDGIVDENDPYASALESASNPAMSKVESYTEVKPTMNERLKNMDMQDVATTFIIPSIIAFAAGRWVFNRASTRVVGTADASLDDFAREMIYHDGDFPEMKLCFNDYSRKLTWLGPNKTNRMLRRYLQSYVKAKTVSPASITTIAYVFTLAELTEKQVAALLVALCRSMGTEKIASAGKLLFMGTRILKSPEGKEALEPIKDLIKGTYRDAEVADTLVETSQLAIAEASYRATVQAGGKTQTSLTVGWETLGLDRETAQRIFAEEAKGGFLSDREAMYGGQSRKYDKKGRQVTEDGSLENPEEAGEDDDDDAADSDEPVSNVQECQQCGYTLFVAAGREEKFFGTGFKCPQCGAGKDQFKGRDDFGED